ncbi:hypothetical protein Tco_0084993 [Tanacetum coccineum]
MWPMIGLGLSKVEGDGEVRVMTRGFGDMVAKLGDNGCEEGLERCRSDVTCGGEVIRDEGEVHLVHKGKVSVGPFVIYYTLIFSVGVQHKCSDSFCSILLLCNHMFVVVGGGFYSYRGIYSSRAILIGQEPFQFGPGDLVGLFYPNRLGYAFHQDKASSVRVPVANVTLLSRHTCYGKNTNSSYVKQRMRPTAPFIPREPLSEDILGATTQREDWEATLPKAILGELIGVGHQKIRGAITQRDTGSYYPKRDWDVLWENGGNLGTSLDPHWSDLELHLNGDEFLRYVWVLETWWPRLDDKVVMEVLVRCWSDGDVVVSHGE